MIKKILALLLLSGFLSACATLVANVPVDVTQEVGSEGGRVAYSDRRVSIDIPAGALDAATSISIGVVPRPPVGVRIIGSTYLFVPGCILFNRDVTVTLPYDRALTSTQVDNIRLVRFESAAQGWVEIPGTINRETFTLTGDTRRLCLFAVALFDPHAPGRPGDPGTGGPRSPVITSFRAVPSAIFRGEESTLSWSVSGPSDLTVTITSDRGTAIGPVSREGSMQVSPTETTLYTLRAQNNDYSISQALTVEVLDRPAAIGAVSPDALLFSVRLGEALSGNTTFRNVGERPFQYRIEGAGTWLELTSGASGTVAPNTTATVGVRVTCNEVGEHNRVLSLVPTDSAIRAHNLNVTLVCLPPVGTLELEVSGLPSGSSATLRVRGPDGSSTINTSYTVTGSLTIADLPPGTYSVSATQITVGSTTYRPTPVEQTVEVRASRSTRVSVRYE